jgi:hypothetical protein
MIPRGDLKKKYEKGQERRREDLPVKPIKLSTVTLCAESKKRLEPATSWSNRETLAFLAAW